MGFNLDGVRMNVVKTAAAGVVTRDTLFVFRREGETVTSEYAGGDVLKGFLVGVLRGGELAFRYCQIDRAHNLDGGVSTCALSRLPDGPITMTERFEWSRGAGENIFEELPRDA